MGGRGGTADRGGVIVVPSPLKRLFSNNALWLGFKPQSVVLLCHFLVVMKGHV